MAGIDYDVFVHFDEAGSAGGGGEGPGAGGPAPAGGDAGGEPAGTVPLESLPEDLRSSKALEPHIRDGRVDVAGLGKSYLNAQRLVGVDKIPAPQKDWKPEQWDAFFTRLGRPSDPANYDLGMPKGVKDPGMSKEMAEGYRKAAHKFGLSKSQAKGVYGWFAEQVGLQVEAGNSQLAAMHEEVMGSLKEEYGEALPGVLKSANKAMEVLGGKDLMEFLGKSGLGNHPEIIKLAVNLSKAMTEDTLSPGVRGAFQGNKLPPKEAQKEIQKLRAHPGYLDGKHPEHAQIISQISDLTSQAHPKEAEEVIELSPSMGF